jgi:outer membrane receptor protein involved in Fe transport
VNQLLELNTEQATAIESVLGPGSALYGSNALHGIINVLQPAPGLGLPDSLSLELGANEFRRVRARLGPGQAGSQYLQLVWNEDGGFRDSSGLHQGKFNYKHRSELFGGKLVTAVSLSDLRQHTAGFIEGEDAYLDSALRTGNANPEAFRNAASQRVYATWQRETDGVTLDARPYLRHTSMRFLQHFLPGQPLEINGHRSAGALVSASWNHGANHWTLGADIEWSDSYLREEQDGPTIGSPFIVATRPIGKHYDYTVRAIGLAPYGQLERTVNDRLALTAGLRLEYVRYRYDNRMLSGNTRDDGSSCDFGGCLYSRPSDRRDHFLNAAPKLALRYTISDSTVVFAALTRGFRLPQSTELYRLQSGQSVADLDSENLDSAELGIRSSVAGWDISANAYAMQKTHSIYRDAEGFNVSDGRTRHRGLELSAAGFISTTVSLGMNVTHGRHTYDFDRVAARGETFVRGADVDTAPRWMANAEFAWQPAEGLEIAASWSYLGDYFLDAENQFIYPGHRLWNLRAVLPLGPSYRLALRLNNVTDRYYADRADYAFGDYRYFPGRGREFFLEFGWSG